MREVTLKIGQSAWIKKGFLRKHAVHFAGMPSSEVYSLVITFTDDYNSMAYNIYVPANHREIDHPQARLEVLAVSPYEIRLRIVKQKG